MTTVNTSDFVKLGLNQNEARVYLALAQRVESDAAQIISDTKFHKNIVYDNLEKLIDKGLVTFVLHDKKKIFQAAEPHALAEFLDQEALQLQKKQDLAKQLQKEIQELQKQVPSRSTAQIYRGKQGIRAFYAKTLEGGDFVVFGGPEESVNVMGETFWLNYDKKRCEKNIHAKMIFSTKLREYAQRIQNKFTTIKFFAGEFEHLTETHIQDNRVAIMVWTEEPMLFLIEDQKVAASYEKYFEEMWKKAAP